MLRERLQPAEAQAIFAGSLAGSRRCIGVAILLGIIPRDTQTTKASPCAGRTWTRNDVRWRARLP